ncbi:MULTISPECIES: hypothetical protein [Haliea]|nr:MULTISPECIES: hypothetical protein [Haliea]
MSDTIAIAGGSGGLGAAMCRHLGSQGLHVVVGYQRRWKRGDLGCRIL